MTLQEQLEQAFQIRDLRLRAVEVARIEAEIRQHDQKFKSLNNLGDYNDG